MAKSGVVLTPTQQRSITALLTSRSASEAATVANVPPRTLTRWLTDDTFKAALRHAEACVLDEATRRLVVLLAASLDTLETLLQDADSRVRLRAAVAILTQAIRLHELRDIEERLAALEAMQHERTR
jgi:hypothetical protein